MSPLPRFDLLTIGHSKHPIERFLAVLHGAGVTAISDVRSRPASRHYPWFSKARLARTLLARTLEVHSIGYRFVGDALGG